MAPPPNYAQNFLLEISAEELRILFNRLRLFAHKKYSWLEDRYGFDIENVICDSICAAFEGTRKWPIETQSVDFFKFICGIIYSKTSHFIEKERKVEMVYLTNDSANEAFNLEIPSQSSRLNQRIYVSQLCKKLKDAICSDPLLTQIVLYLEETPDMEVKDIAERMHLSKGEMRNAIKRLDRKAKLILEAENHE